jgi:thiol-disulfide isomerase/thioredoxin
MKPANIQHLALAAVLGALAGSAPAAELGMSAPPLHISKWVRGRPVDLAKAKGGQVVVVEFWATWCPPCKESIPHLTALQKRFARQGVTIIGITDEPEGDVRKMLKAMGNKMDYTIAIDDGKRTWDAYMKAFGEEGIPHAFVVNREGRIAWTGTLADRREELDTVLEKIVAGTHDLEAVVFAGRFRERVHDYLHLMAEGDSPLARAEGRKLLEDGAKFPDLLNDFAWEVLTHDHGEVAFRDKPLALEAARRANSASGGKDASILDTLALALFENGKTAEAIQAVRDAIKLCRDEELLVDLKARQARYEKGAK